MSLPWKITKKEYWCMYASSLTLFITEVRKGLTADHYCYTKITYISNILTHNATHATNNMWTCQKSNYTHFGNVEKRLLRVTLLRQCKFKWFNPQHIDAYRHCNWVQCVWRCGIDVQSRMLETYCPNLDSFKLKFKACSQWWSSLQFGYQKIWYVLYTAYIIAYFRDNNNIIITQIIYPKHVSIREKHA